MIIELDKHDEQSLVVCKRDDNIHFVICTMFDESKPEGNMWYRGHHYDSLDTALVIKMVNQSIMVDIGELF